MGGPLRFFSKLAQTFISTSRAIWLKKPPCVLISKGFKPGLRSRSRSESVVFAGVGVGVGVDKIYRLRPTPGKFLFAIHSNRHADYFGIFLRIFV